jgi:EAL domain-containing protein (putative c-di-GMP-specific phosphodiesterase class I)
LFLWVGHKKPSLPKTMARLFKWASGLSERASGVLAIVASNRGEPVPGAVSTFDLPALVHSILSPHRLELEITEGVLIEDFSRAISILRPLKALWVRIAMDDFGTGYSSLRYLQAFPFYKIKIDQTFIYRLD